MKKGTIVLLTATLITVAAISYSFVRDSSAAGSARDSSVLNKEKIVNVDELAAKPDDYQGDIILSGVVAGINKEEGVFGVIDAREFKSCGVLSCARYTLPVKYSQAAPPLKTFVNISGRLSRGQNGMVIIAGNVEVVK